MKQMKKFFPIAMSLLPAFAFAAFDYTNLIDKAKNIVSAGVPILFGLIVIYFLYGVVKFVTAGGDEEARTNARNAMIYAVIGMFIAAAIWGLVAALGGFLGVDVGGNANMANYNLVQ